MNLNRGNPNAKIWIVVDHPTVNDLGTRAPFSGSLGHELEGQLRHVGLSIDDCYCTYVTAHRPERYDMKDWYCTKTQAPGRGFLQWGDSYVAPHIWHDIQDLRTQLSKSAATVVIAMGELPLLALTENSGIGSWRGSVIETVAGIKCIPTYCPLKVLKMFEWRFIAIQDLRRAKRESYTEGLALPPENFEVHAPYEKVKLSLAALKQKLDAREETAPPYEIALDVETRWGHITHLGMAWSESEAFSINFLDLSSPEKNRYTPKEEVAIVLGIKEICHHPRATFVGQNFLYDIQYMAHDWGFIPLRWHDTMTAWHTVYSGLQKSLAFIASMICPHYQYWKDVSSDDEPNYSIYNARDCVRTWEIWQAEKQLLTDSNCWPQYEEQLAAQRPNLQMMLRGIRQDVNLRGTLGIELFDAMAHRENIFAQFTTALVGEAQLIKSKKAQPWYRSPTQQATIFYELFKLPVQRNRKTGQPSCDDAALQILRMREPLLQPIFDLLLEYRSLGVFLSTFVQSPLDWDKRIRSSFGVGMTETFRNTSSEDVFGFGGNLQNIPAGDKDA